jgi:hypothetical protein
MNKAQEKVINDFRTALLEQASNGGRTPVEVKRFDSTVAGDSIQLIIIVGMVGDEGTQAEVYCRDLRQVFIGQRGGCRCRVVGRNGKTEFANLQGFSECVRG